MLHATAQRTASKAKRQVTIVNVVTWGIGVVSAVVIVAVSGTVIYTKLKARNPVPPKPDYVMKADAQAAQDFERAATKKGDMETLLAGNARPESAAPAAAPPRAGGAIENLQGKQTAIAQAVKEFFEANSVTELLPLVRDARRVRPVIEQYYFSRPMEKRTWKGVGWVKPVEEPGYRFAYVQARFEDTPPVHVVVEETDVGFLVDWESSVLYCEMGWKEFQSVRPREPRSFRVLASRVDKTFDSERSGKNYKFLVLKHPAEEGFVFGRFDPLDTKFQPLVAQLDLCQWKDAPVTLRLQFRGDSKLPNEVEIDSVEGKGWLILGPARK